MKRANFNFESMRLDQSSFVYELETPDPLAMKNDVYRGVLKLDVGPGGDIDFGENATTDAVLNINFVLDVAHEFSIQFANANPQVSLLPVGGWHQWVDYNRAPKRLQQELPFSLTSSSEFSIKMRCEHDANGRCGIRDQGAGTVVPVDVDVTMPGMRNVATGAAAISTPLVSEQSGLTAPRFSPDSYLQQRPSKLHFSTRGSPLDEMLKAPGSKWKGDVTVIFDSDP
ncbi:hypothetical protein [Stenotrophomonas geniculata]|uniref:hypothetical protein n=1 Tax=Stenotrophomonas geniculata TaxID=86188 RepID=UPI002E7AA723|nr:hypothetical protein [Stenotrophomonas geniculata]